MKNDNLIEIARKENKNIAGWFVAGIFLLIMSIIGILSYFIRLTRNWESLAICVMGLPMGLGAIIYAIWDICRPSVLITMDDTRESINIYCQSQWINIRISDIKMVDHRNYRSRHRTLDSGWLSIKTTDGEYKIKNVKDVAHVWYDIKYLSEKSEQ